MNRETSAKNKQIGDLVRREMALYRLDVTDQISMGVTIEVWIEEFEAIPEGILKDAVKRHRRDPHEGKFFPKPANIHAQIRSIYRDRFEQSWALIRKAIRSVGKYRSIDFGNPRVHAAIEDSGGWVALCNSSSDEMTKVKERIFDAFIASQNRSPELLPSRVAGMFEIENGKVELHTIDLTQKLAAPKQACLTAR